MLATCWSSLGDLLSSLRVILFLTLILLAKSGLIVFQNFLLSVTLLKSSNYLNENLSRKVELSVWIKPHSSNLTNLESYTSSSRQSVQICCREEQKGENKGDCKAFCVTRKCKKRKAIVKRFALHASATMMKQKCIWNSFPFYFRHGNMSYLFCTI